tara:strand:- start:159 stop:587 length:429 start_codon:yes stop_codon:yes gene_type:complete
MSSVNNMYRKYFGFKKINETSDLEEADLLNKISDYRGGVLYQLIDPATAPDVKRDIAQFAAKKKMHIIKTEFNDAQGYGFFYFRLGEDPGKESQRIQGFISQLPEVRRFRFTTLKQEEPTRAPEEVVPPTAPLPPSPEDQII